MIFTIVAILILLWFIGLLANIGGGIIHLLLVAALVVFIFNLLTGRKSV